MGFLNLFKNTASRRGELISDYIILLGGDSEFRKLLSVTPKPMSYRLLIDHILVCSGVAIYLLSFKYSNNPSDVKQAFDGFIKRQITHLKEMSDTGVTFNVKDVIVDDREKLDFIMDGWKLNEITGISTIISVIGDRQMEKYSRAVDEGIAEVKKYSDGARITSRIMQESKKRCGEEGFPYAELKSIYNNCILNIINAVNGK